MSQGRKNMINCKMSAVDKELSGVQSRVVRLLQTGVVREGCVEGEAVKGEGGEKRQRGGTPCR